jgi:putative hydrolase of the HAD superfamily
MTENTKKIKAILFDFMGVLLFPRADYKPDKMVDEIDRAIGKVTDDVIFQKETIEKYDLNEERFNIILDRIVDKYGPFEPLWEMLPEMRKRYKLAIINDGTSLTLPKFRDRYHLEENFDLFVSSAIEGCKKPQENIYQLATSRLGVKPEECLFMDDSLQNIETAARLGMATIHWNDPQASFEEFKRFIGGEGR